MPGALRNRLLDDTLLVFLSDVHIGGQAGSEIFQSAAELTALLQDLNHHRGPVELVLAGDFLDLLRMGDPGHGEERVTATIARPDYQELFAALRSFTRAPGHRVVYLAGNHDAEVWGNTPIRRSLIEAGLIDDFALSYSASFNSLPEQLIYCEHGNQFDPSNTLADYANPLDTPVGAHVVVQVRAGWRWRYGSSPSPRSGCCRGSSGPRSRGGCRASHLPPTSHGSSPGGYPPREPVSLGGCRMANNPAADVVDTDGQVFDHPGLYVLDRAILSATTDANPSHRVIAAARPLLSIRHGIGFN